MAEGQADLRMVRSLGEPAGEHSSIAAHTQTHTIHTNTHAYTRVGTMNQGFVPFSRVPATTNMAARLVSEGEKDAVPALLAGAAGGEAVAVALAP